MQVQIPSTKSWWNEWSSSFTDAVDAVCLLPAFSAFRDQQVYGGCSWVTMIEMARTGTEPSGEEHQI